MAVKTFYALTTTAVTPNWFSILQDGGTAPTATTTTYGFVGSSVGYSPGHMGATGITNIARASPSYIDALSAPTPGSAATNNASGDSFVTPTSLTGVFPAGNWTLKFGVAATSLGSTHSGLVRCRVYASPNANGSVARLLSSSTLVCSTVSVVVPTAAAVQSQITWAAPAITLDNEYLFFQVEWQCTAAGASSSTARIQQASTILTTTNLGPLPVLSTGSPALMMGV